MRFIIMMCGKDFCSLSPMWEWRFWFSLGLEFVGFSICHLLSLSSGKQVEGVGRGVVQALRLHSLLIGNWFQSMNTLKMNAIQLCCN